MATKATARRPRPTMNDVAEVAGVSVQTVSRVVNGSVKVSPARLALVRAAIDKLGFRRNEFARQLRQGTATSIGLVVEDVSDPFYSTLTRAVEDVAFGSDHMLLASSSAGDPQRAEQVIRSLGARGAIGLVVTPTLGTDLDFVRSELTSGCSMVFVDRPLIGIDADTVLADNVGGATAGVAQLIAHGHRRIAFFGDTESIFTSTERRDGYRAALLAVGIPFDPRLELLSLPSGADTPALIEEVLALDDPPTAVFAGNNRWSVRLLRHLAQRRSQSLALIGFDDFELSDALTPGVTVISQDPAAMGRIAAELLFRRVGGDTGPSQQVVLGTTLIQRGSGELPGPFRGS